MTERRTSATASGLLLISFILVLCVPRTLLAHCDTMDGPVVVAAKAALQEGDVTAVLKWVKAEHEREIREAFSKTLEVRKFGAVARDLADRYFFETLVRIHREGEGEPYTGLKPSGTDPGAGIAGADRALDKNSVDDLVRSMTAQMTTEIRERYIRAAEKRKHADESVQAGREYVEAYVEFIHYVERLQEDVTKSAGAHAAYGEGTEVSSRHVANSWSRGVDDLVRRRPGNGPPGPAPVSITAPCSGLGGPGAPAESCGGRPEPGGRRTP